MSDAAARLARMSCPFFTAEANILCELASNAGFFVQFIDVDCIVVHLADSDDLLLCGSVDEALCAVIVFAQEV